jgi:hypothetical protein
MAPTPPTLKHVLNISLIPGTPLDAGLTPFGKANWVDLNSGTVSDPGKDNKVIADILPGGGDYCGRHMDANALSIDLRVIAKSTKENDTSLFKITSKGFDYLIPPVAKMLDGQTHEPPPPGAKMPEALYGAEIVSIETSSKEYWGLNFATMVARSALVLGEGGVDRVDYEVYQVVV